VNVKLGTWKPHKEPVNQRKKNKKENVPIYPCSSKLVRLFSTRLFFSPFLPIGITFFIFRFHGGGFIFRPSSAEAAVAICTSSSPTPPPGGGEADAEDGFVVDGGLRGTRMTWSGTV
jgi:hypothetical protein